MNFYEIRRTNSTIHDKSDTMHTSNGDDRANDDAVSEKSDGIQKISFFNYDYNAMFSMRARIVAWWRENMAIFLFSLDMSDGRLFIEYPTTVREWARDRR